MKIYIKIFYFILRKKMELNTYTYALQKIQMRREITQTARKVFVFFDLRKKMLKIKKEKKYSTL